MRPKCSIHSGWGDKTTDGQNAIARNKFGGFECEWHHSLPRSTQPDSFFRKGVLCKEIDAGTFLGNLQLWFAYIVFRCFNVKLWKKN